MRFLLIMSMLLLLCSHTVVARDAGSWQAALRVVASKPVTKVVDQLKRVLLRQSVAQDGKQSGKLAGGIAALGLTALLAVSPVDAGELSHALHQVPNYRQLLQKTEGILPAQQRYVPHDLPATAINTKSNSNLLAIKSFRLHWGLGESKVSSMRDYEAYRNRYYDTTVTDIATGVGSMGISLRGAIGELKLLGFSFAADAGEERLRWQYPHIHRFGFGARYDVILAYPLRLLGVGDDGMSFTRGRYDRLDISVGPYASLYTRNEYLLVVNGAVLERHRKYDFKAGALWQVDLHLMGNINLTYVGTDDALSNAEDGSLHLFFLTLDYDSL